MSRFGTQFFRRKMADQSAAEATPPTGTDDEAPRRRRRIATRDLRRVDDEGQRSETAATPGLDPLLARLVLACWNRFFDNFRHDELAMEFPRYQQEAEDVVTALQRMDENDTPDLRTCQRMLFLLSRFSRERFKELNERIDELADEGKQLKSQLDAQEIAYCVSHDELQRCLQLLDHDVTAEAMLDDEESSDGDDPKPAPRMIESLIRRMERDREALTVLANELGAGTLAKLPSETQLYLNFFRSS